MKAHLRRRRRNKRLMSYDTSYYDATWNRPISVHFLSVPTARAPQGFDGFLLLK